MGVFGIFKNGEFEEVGRGEVGCAVIWLIFSIICLISAHGLVRR